ncbi:unnamed protein product [Knipowitschia caucasica]|uniref:RETREG1-3/ARL6IP-like N-terminal reticulon-homology domain-containing protein n=2 Tax=Knipowitschia caucasica TaxID=637954 RepID=A0AAV2LD01_KNICA
MADMQQLSGQSLELVPGSMEPVPGRVLPLPGSVEALFPAEEHQAPADMDPELARLSARILGWLQQYELLLLWGQRLLVWERPVCSVSAAVTLNTLFWLLSSTSLRPLFLLSVSLLGLMLLERWKHLLFRVTQTAAEPIQRGAEELEPRLLSVTELSVHLADSFLSCCSYLQEMMAYKHSHPGKFCALTCGSCLLLALLGHYVPGVMISYIIALSVLLWPLVVYHELIQRMYTGLEPILMKLDYSMKGETDRRKEKRKVKKEQEVGTEGRADTETESEEEEELCCFAATVDVKTTALAMAITDSELSDEEASILESGGFSVSRATTPQLTDVSEDLDQQSVHSDPEEAFLRDLPEFPSVEEFEPQSLLFQRAEEPLSPASLLLQHLASPLHFVNTHFNGHAPSTHIQVQTSDQTSDQTPDQTPAVRDQAQRSLEALSEQIVTTAISTVVHNTLSALLRSGEPEEEQEEDQFLPTTMDCSNAVEEEVMAEPGDEEEEVTSASCTVPVQDDEVTSTVEEEEEEAVTTTVQEEEEEAVNTTVQEEEEEAVTTTVQEEEEEAVTTTVLEEEEEEVTTTVLEEEEEDFELLDQSELDLAAEELDALSNIT